VAPLSRLKKSKKWIALYRLDEGEKMYTIETMAKASLGYFKAT
jgi:hypothetical protein